MHCGASFLGFVMLIEPVQEAIMDVRPSFVAAGIYLRPRIFPPRIQELPDVPADAASASDGSPNKDLPYTQTQTLYLKTTGAAKGVLQVHRGPRTHVAGHTLLEDCFVCKFACMASKVEEEDALQGYRCLFRAEEVWLIAKRKQTFANWCTKWLLV